MVASLKSADLQIVELFKKSIDIYFKYVNIKEDKEKKNKPYNKSRKMVVRIAKRELSQNPST